MSLGNCCARASSSILSSSSIPTISRGPSFALIRLAANRRNCRSESTISGSVICWPDEAGRSFQRRLQPDRRLETARVLAGDALLVFDLVQADERRILEPVVLLVLWFRFRSPPQCHVDA